MNKKILSLALLCLFTYNKADNASELQVDLLADYPVKTKVENKAKERIVIPLTKIITTEFNKIKPRNPINQNYINKIINIESRYDSLAVGTSGERGLMQIMPNTWSQYTTMSFDSAFIRKYNISIGVQVLKKIHYLLRIEHPTWETLNLKEQQRLIGAAYNGGYQRLKDAEYDINNMPKRTQRYVNKL